MKKVFAMLALAATMFVGGNAFAQLGINVGYAPETFADEDGNNTQFQGFFVGGNYNFNLSGDINLSIGAQYRRNSLTTEDGFNIGNFVATSGKATHTQSIIDIPVLFNYGFRSSGALRLSIFVGPTFSYAISGNTHTDGKINVLGIQVGDDNDFDWYGENTNRERLNINGTVGAMITYNRIRLFGGYNYGFSDLDKGDKTSLKTKGYFFGLGFSL